MTTLTANITTDQPEALARELNGYYDVTDATAIEGAGVIALFSTDVDEDVVAEIIHGAAHEIGTTATIDDMGPAGGEA